MEICTRKNRLTLVFLKGGYSPNGFSPIAQKHKTKWSRGFTSFAVILMKKNPGKTSKSEDIGGGCHLKIF